MKVKVNLKSKLICFGRRSILISIILHIIRFIKNKEFRDENPFINVSNLWHSKISIKLSRVIPKFISDCLDNFFFNRKIYFLINNLPYSVGHCYGEVDYASRFLLENKTTKLIYIAPKYRMISDVSKLVRDDIAKRIYFLFGGFLSILFLPVIFSFKKSLLDLSLGQYDIISNKTMPFGDFWNIKYRKHVEIVNRTGPSTLSLPEENYIERAKEKFFTKLGIKYNYIVIQIKDTSINATFAPNDPQSLVPALQLLLSKGFILVQGGRESTPKCFKELGVIPYSSMKIASPINDAILYSDCALAISSGSGVNNIPSKFGIPQLILNVWNFGYVAEKVNLVWPTRLINSRNKKLVSLKDQFEIIKKWNPVTAKVFYDEFEVLDANSQDIMSSLIEVMEFKKTGKWVKSKLREKFYKEYKEEVFTIQQSQIASEFIKKYYNHKLF